MSAKGDRKQPNQTVHDHCIVNAYQSLHLEKSIGEGGGGGVQPAPPPPRPPVPGTPAPLV